MSKPNIEIVSASLELEWEYNTFNNECPICQNSLYEPSVESKERNIIINCCKHGYHQECIEKWLKTKRNCPMCKVEWKANKINNQNGSRFNILENEYLNYTSYTGSGNYIRPSQEINMIEQINIV